MTTWSPRESSCPCEGSQRKHPSLCSGREPEVWRSVASPWLLCLLRRPAVPQEGSIWWQSGDVVVVSTETSIVNTLSSILAGVPLGWDLTTSLKAKNRVVTSSFQLPLYSYFDYVVR